MEKKTLVLVEDSEEDLSQWTKCLDRYIRERQAAVEYKVFRNGFDFLENYRPMYDIILMDIEMPQMDGMATARKLREMDVHTALIFVTHMAQFAVQGYEVSALDYLVKPITYPNFSIKLQRALDLINRADGKRVVLNGKTEMHSISVQDLLYVEVRGHHLIFHQTSGQEIDVCGSLNNLEESLQGLGFTRCSTCYLIHMKYISKISGLTVQLADGTELQISRRRRKEFVDEFAAYMGQTGGGAASCSLL